MLLELGMIAAIFVAACAGIAWRLVRRRRMGDEGGPDDTARIRAILAELAAERAQAAGPKAAPPQRPSPQLDDRFQQAEAVRDLDHAVDGQAQTPAEVAPLMDMYGKKIAQRG